jgi:excisionase family DNA binding protein
MSESIANRGGTDAHEFVQMVPIERSNGAPKLTSTEAAELLGVHASTVKRWCNEGALDFGRTEGGHRRFALDHVTDFARNRSISTMLTPFHPHEKAVWTALRAVRENGSFGGLHALALSWIHEGRTNAVGRLYETLIDMPEVPLCELFDEGIRGLMSLIGREWRAGRLRVAEEHMVSQVLLEILIKLRADRVEDLALGTRQVGPVAVVGTMEGNQHHLGSMCVRLLLEALGWQVHYLGPDVPLDDFAVVQRTRGAGLLCVSLAPPAAGGDLARAVETLARFYDPAYPYALAFGGTVEGTIEPDLLRGPFIESRLFAGCRDFREALESGFGRRTQDVAP